MLSPRVRELALEDLDALPDPCRGCMFWQTTNARKGYLERDPQAQDAWWQAVQLDWGAPGKAIWHGENLVAFALYAPPLHVQRVRSLTIPASDDSLVLATMWTALEERGAGHARHLLQVVARDAVSRGLQALEAYGAPQPTEGRCVLPGSVLEALGFTRHRPHPRVPLYRLELDRTVSWPSVVGHALGEVLSTLQGRERAKNRPALERQALSNRQPPRPGQAS